MTITTPFEDKDWQAIELSEHTYPLYLALAAETPEASRFSLEELVKNYAFMVKHDRLSWTILSRDDFNLYFVVPKNTSLRAGWYKVRTKSQVEMLSDAMNEIVADKIGDQIRLELTNAMAGNHWLSDSTQRAYEEAYKNIVKIVAEMVNDI